MQAVLITAKLVDAPEVWRRIAVREDQTLVDVHEALQTAFGWENDHLYAFWLSGEFWDGPDTEYTAPFEPEPGVKTADIALSELPLADGQSIAYLFDFGDEWRVLLTIGSFDAADGGSYPRLVAREREAPPQYPDFEDESARSDM